MVRLLPKFLLAAFAVVVFSLGSQMLGAKTHTAQASGGLELGCIVVPQPVTVQAQEPWVSNVYGTVFSQIVPQTVVVLQPVCVEHVQFVRLFLPNGDNCWGIVPGLPNAFYDACQAHMFFHDGYCWRMQYSDGGLCNGYDGRLPPWYYGHPFNGAVVYAQIGQICNQVNFVTFNPYLGRRFY